jgi:hypothetical protein
MVELHQKPKNELSLAGKSERQAVPWKQHSAVRIQQKNKTNTKTKDLLPQRAQRPQRKNGYGNGLRRW